MGLISGVLMGVMFGIGLMAGWYKMMQYRSTKRVAKVKWLNKLLSKLWPFVADVSKSKVLKMGKSQWTLTFGRLVIQILFWALASIPIQLKDLQVFTVIRVIFQRSEEIPCISAVVVALHSEVFDKNIGQDKRLGIAKLPLTGLEAGTSKEIDLRLLPALDMQKIKDKKDRDYNNSGLHSARAWLVPKVADRQPQ